MHTDSNVRGPSRYMKLKSACLLGLILFFTCKIITLAQLSEFSAEGFRAIDEITTEKSPAPPTNIKTTDKKNDDGTSIAISWMMVMEQKTLLATTYCASPQKVISRQLPKPSLRQIKQIIPTIQLREAKPTHTQCKPSHQPEPHQIQK